MSVRTWGCKHEQTHPLLHRERASDLYPLGAQAQSPVTLGSRNAPNAAAQFSQKLRCLSCFHFYRLLISVKCILMNTLQKPGIWDRELLRMKEGLVLAQCPWSQTWQAG